MNGGGSPPPGPSAAAQTTCARCQARIPFADIRVFANRCLCPTCHGELVAQGRPPGFPPGTPPQLALPTWQQVLVRIGQARLTLAIARCIVYLSAFAILGPGAEGERSLLTAFLVGAYAADNITWLFFRLADLPAQLASFPIETAITVGSGTLLITWQGLIPYAGDIHIVAMAFPAFLLVLAGKMLAWGVMRSAEAPAT